MRHLGEISECLGRSVTVWMNASAEEDDPKYNEDTASPEQGFPRMAGCGAANRIPRRPLVQARAAALSDCNDVSGHGDLSTAHRIYRRSASVVEAARY